MAIGDWFLARSEAFRLLMTKFRDHKQDTIISFSKVKAKHHKYEEKFEELETKLKELERTLDSLQLIEPIRIKKKKEE